ncbi:hypothetical protein COCNU_08G003670 [Cocos nucifera]|uniref:Cathepsin propeptide inhibitor domain-containing protein n=1 Tax=Cocos nucifera TaxID=13894 RepID=A0A8K0IHG6_COCNU|nr:hypothetical protein COCNU_08G003670 [Cocos nucifera]
MVKVATYFAMVFGAFVFWQSMDKLHVWIALHQDEKIVFFWGRTGNFLQERMVYDRLYIATDGIYYSGLSSNCNSFSKCLTVGIKWLRKVFGRYKRVEVIFFHFNPKPDAAPVSFELLYDSSNISSFDGCSREAALIVPPNPIASHLRGPFPLYKPHTNPLDLHTPNPPCFYLLTKMAKVLLFGVVVALAFGLAHGVPFDEKDLGSVESLWNLYERWRGYHTVSRDLKERHKRFNVFQENVKFVHELNKKDATYKLALNMFGDMTNQQFRSWYAGSKVQHHRMHHGSPRGGAEGCNHRHQG